MCQPFSSSVPWSTNPLRYFIEKEFCCQMSLQNLADWISISLDVSFWRIRLHVFFFFFSLIPHVNAISITVVEAVKSNINVPAVLVPGEGSFPSLQTGNILLRAHMAFLGVCTWQGRGSLLAAVWREQWKPTAPTCTVSLMPSCLLSHSEG